MPRTIAFRVHQRILQHVATTGQDPVEVTVSVDTLSRMGALNRSLTTMVGLHPQWALEFAKGPVDDAVFAVDNCTDAETLNEIARRDKRVNVARALVRNRHLSEETCRRIRTAFPHLYCPLDHDDDDEVVVDAVPEEAAPVPEHLLVPTKFAEDSFEVFDLDHPLRGLITTQVPSGVVTEDVDGLITAAMGVNAQGTVKRIIDDYYRDSADHGRVPILWDLMSAHPVDLLEQLDADSRAAVLAGTLSRRRYGAMDRWMVKKTPHLWDERFVGALIASDTDADARRAVTTGNTGRILTPKALRLALANPAWHSLAKAHTPNSREVKLILKSLGDEGAGLYRKMNGFSRGVIATVFSYKGPGALEEAFSSTSLRDAALIFQGPGDPLFPKVLERARVSHLIDYLLSGLHFHSSFPQWPPVEQIPWFAEVLNSSDAAISELREATSCLFCEISPERTEAPTLEWVRTLSELVLGAWEFAMACPRAAEGMLAQVRECGVDPGDLVRVLSTDEGLPALTWPQVLSSLKGLA